MNVVPLAADSLGVRSVATYVECGATRIVIDPGASLGRSRFNLPPADLEWAALKRANDRISGYAARATAIFVSHYHEDHFRYDPAIYRGRTVWAKDPRRMLGQAQGERASKLWKGIAGGCRLDAAEGRRMETPDAELSASSPLSHGPDGTDLGYVVALTVTDRREGFRFVHASDVQGPLSPVATAYLIRERPDLLYLSGRTRVPRAGARPRGDRPRDRQPVPRDRRDGLSRDHGPSRRPRRRVPRAVPRLWESGAVVTAAGLPRTRRHRARVHPPRSLGGAAQGRRRGNRAVGGAGTRPAIAGGRRPPAPAARRGRREGSEADRGDDSARGRRVSDYVLERRFWLPRARPEVFEFFAAPENLAAGPAPGGAPSAGSPRRPRGSRRAPCSTFASACSGGRSAGG